MNPPAFLPLVTSLRKRLALRQSSESTAVWKAIAQSLLDLVQLPVCARDARAIHRRTIYLSALYVSELALGIS